MDAARFHAKLFNSGSKGRSGFSASSSKSKVQTASSSAASAQASGSKPSSSRSAQASTSKPSSSRSAQASTSKPSSSRSAAPGPARANSDEVAALDVGSDSNDEEVEMDSEPEYLAHKWASIRSAIIKERFELFERTAKKNPKLRFRCRYCEKVITTSPGQHSNLNHHFDPKFKGYCSRTSKPKNKSLIAFELSPSVDPSASQKEAQRMQQWLIANPNRKPAFAPEVTRREILAWVIETAQPFSAPSDESFKRILASVDPKAVQACMSPTTVARDLEVLHRSLNKQGIAAIMQCLGRFSLQQDAWSSPSSRFSFVCYIASFVDADWNYREIVVEFAMVRGRHTAATGVGHFLRLFDDHPGLLAKFSGIITSDLAEANVRMARILEPRLAHDDDALTEGLPSNDLARFEVDAGLVLCLAHHFNLAVKAAYKVLGVDVPNRQKRVDSNQTAPSDQPPAPTIMVTDDASSTTRTGVNAAPAAASASTSQGSSSNASAAQASAVDEVLTFTAQRSVEECAEDEQGCDAAALSDPARLEACRELEEGLLLQDHLVDQLDPDTPSILITTPVSVTSATAQHARQATDAADATPAAVASTFTAAAAAASSAPPKPRTAAELRAEAAAQAEEELMKLQLSSVLNRLSDWINMIHHSPTRRIDFDYAASQIFPDSRPPPLPKMCNATRWNSRYEQIAGALRARRVLERLAFTEPAHAYRAYELADHEWAALARLSVILHIVQVLTLEMERAGPTLSNVLRAHGVLRATVEQELSQLRSEQGAAHKEDQHYAVSVIPALEAMEKVLKKYRDRALNSRATVLAAVLHPGRRIQSIQQFYPTEAKRIEELVLSTIEDLGLRKAASPTTSRPATTSVSAYDDYISKIESRGYQPSHTIEEELSAYYRNENPMSVTGDPLEWWKTHCKTYPTLAQLAATFLGAPGSTANVERSFSRARLFCTERRPLGHTKIRELVMCSLLMQQGMSYALESTTAPIDLTGGT